VSATTARPSALRPAGAWLIIALLTAAVAVQPAAAEAVP
jgi:hypothetical protein